MSESQTTSDARELARVVLEMKPSDVWGRTKSAWVEDAKALAWAVIELTGPKQ